MRNRTRNAVAPWAIGRPAYEIKGASKSEAEVYILDAIWRYGVNASDLAKELAGIKASTINVHINSPGGLVFDAWTIYQALRSHKAKIVVHIDGLAASAATMIALAGDEIRMARGAFFMIHRPWTVAIGDAEDLRKEVDVMLKMERTMEDLYSDKSALSIEEVRAAMAEETWYSATEAKEAGFVDLIVDGNDVIDDDAETEVLAMYQQAVAAVVQAAQAKAEPETAEPPKTVREFEDRLREMGYKNAAAKSIAANGFRPDHREDDGHAAPAPEHREDDGAVMNEGAAALALLNALICTSTVAQRKEVH